MIRTKLAGVMVMALAAAAPALAEPAARPPSEVEKKAVEFLLAAQGKNAAGNAYDVAQRPHADGAWMPEMGPAITSMVVKGLLQAGKTPDDPAIKKALAFVERFRKDDGGYWADAVPSYNTAITLSMFASLPQTPELKEKIAGAQKFLRSTQSLEGSVDKQGAVINKEHPWYGGAGYYGKGAKRPDMSNTSYFLDALVETGVKAEDPSIQAALVFVSRCQASSETNNQPWAKGRSSGGFIYSTANSGESMFGTAERDGQQVLVEYGSMTYAGLKSFIYAGLKKDDPRVKSAYRWITGHWTLNENPGTGKQTGLFYYYHTFAKALRVYGEDQITDAKGIKHDWRAELTETLKKRQNADGSFVNKNEERWLEGNPVLATAYVVLALQEARK